MASPTAEPFRLPPMIFIWIFCGVSALALLLIIIGAIKNCIDKQNPTLEIYDVDRNVDAFERIASTESELDLDYNSEMEEFQNEARHELEEIQHHHH